MYGLCVIVAGYQLHQWCLQPHVCVCQAMVQLILSNTNYCQSMWRDCGAPCRHFSATWRRQGVQRQNGQEV